MRKLLVAAIAGMWITGVAFAHPATEQYIPIGQSPGEGAVHGRAGATVESAAADGQTVLTIVPEGAQAADASGSAFVIGPNTRIYIDRSAENQPNTLGTLADLQSGRVVEARLADPQTRVAAWVKVRP